MKQFLSAADAGDISALVSEAIALKADPHAHRCIGAGRTLGLIFMNPSLRTRISTQKAGQLLGMDVVVLNADKDSWALEFADGAVMDQGTVEHIRDAAPVLGQYCDILGVRSFPRLADRDEDAAEGVIGKFAALTGSPLVSLESALRHPLQSLADMMTIREHAAVPRPKVVLTWAPHIRALPQAVGNSFAEWTLASGHDLTIACPEGYDLDPAFTNGATIVHDQKEALRDADFVYVKNWSSWSDYGKVLTQDRSWMLTRESLRPTNDAKVMHCLPVRRNLELSDEVLDSPSSIVQQEAGNRVWAAMAVLRRMLLAGRP
jgi:N-succinyl-L-ornithine transcarbamylase